ncbi:immunoglobulin superfamily member 6-like [Rana temporaria]|uniref:immunoglobulin superfamily member 6-like n=1 Tax=Rana temporaria TaxID=8407 RepID=UPI001AAE060A|nr:immunoglobulin superfamily member 6-like [Rana temporaria]
MDKLGLSTLILLKIILLYYHCGVKGCQVTLKQEKNKATQLWETITLSCWYNATNCPDEIEVFWFRFLASSQENLSKGSDRFIISKDSKNLEIKSVTAQDSGIYFCGITHRNRQPTKQNIGQGTILQVSDGYKKTFTAGKTSLIFICTLLFVYCVTVFSYYAYRSKGKFCNLKEDKDMNQTGRSYKTRRIFQAIAQEYHRRYDGKTQKRNQVIENDTIYQNTSYTH